MCGDFWCCRFVHDDTSWFIFVLNIAQNNQLSIFLNYLLLILCVGVVKYMYEIRSGISSTGGV